MMAKNMMLILVVIMVLIMLSSIMKSNEKKMMKEKNNPFECGFDPNHKMRAPFSLRFFILTIVFLIFDIEIASMLPIPISSTNSFNNIILWNSMIWIMLSLGMFFEWKQGALSWLWILI